MKDTSTALACDGKTIEWARAEKSRGSQSPAAGGTLGPLPREADFTDPTDYEKAAAAYARKAAAKTKDSATLAIASDTLVFRTARLPSTDPDEIAAMSLTQMEKDAPLPMEEMVCAHEILLTGETDALVLSACAPTAAIVRTAAAAGLSPDRVERVDARILGILPLLAQAGVITNNSREVILVEEGPAVTLVVTDSGLPVLIRSLGPLAATTGPMLFNTVKLSLIQAEIDHGASPVTHLCAFCGDSGLAAAAVASAEQLGCPFKTAGSDSVPAAAFGCALRTLAGTRLNLFPDAWRTLLAENRFRRVFRVSLLGGAALWLLLVGWLYGWPALLEQRIKTLNNTVEELAPAESKVNDIRNRIKIIETYSDRTFSPLEALLEVAVNLPRGIELASFRYDGGNKQTLVEGRSRVPTLVYDFMDRLKTSQLFGEVKLTSGPTLNRTLGLNVFELLIEFVNAEQEEAPAE